MPKLKYETLHLDGFTVYVCNVSKIHRIERHGWPSDWGMDGWSNIPNEYASIKRLWRRDKKELRKVLVTYFSWGGSTNIVNMINERLANG